MADSLSSSVPSRLAVLLLVSPREPESLPITVASRISTAAHAASPRVDLYAQMAYQFAASPRNRTMYLALKSLGFHTTCIHTDPLLDVTSTLNLTDTVKAGVLTHDDWVGWKID